MNQVLREIKVLPSRGQFFYFVLNFGRIWYKMEENGKRRRRKMTEKIYSIEEIRVILAEILKDTTVQKAILFGSYAKQNSTVQSDIDILVDSNETLKGLKFYALIDLIQEAFNKKVDVIEKSEVIKNSKIDKEIKNIGVVVYER